MFIFNILHFKSQFKSFPYNVIRIHSFINNYQTTNFIYTLIIPNSYVQKLQVWLFFWTIDFSVKPIDQSQLTYINHHKT